jgi:GNAT superfamily N-acetyltransferase
VESSNAAFGLYQPPLVLTADRVGRWERDLGAIGSRWWVGCHNDVAIGIVGTCASRDPLEPGVGELDTVAISPAHWRQGFGRALMAVANAELDATFERSILWTWNGYEAAARFYPSVGWERSGITRDDGRQVCFTHSPR